MYEMFPTIVLRGERVINWKGKGFMKDQRKEEKKRHF